MTASNSVRYAIISPTKIKLSKHFDNTHFSLTSTDFYSLNVLRIETLVCEMSRKIRSNDTVLFMVITRSDVSESESDSYFQIFANMRYRMRQRGLLSDIHALTQFLGGKSM